MPRSKSSKRWLQEHFDDEYVRRARQQGYRSRAVFKLQEIQERDHILRSGMNVVDLGAAPGGWSQYAAGVVGPQGRVIALDILPMDPLPGVEFIQGDFREQAIVEQLLATVAAHSIDLVISDMAPNMSGIKEADQLRGIYLAELAADLVQHCLRRGGDFLVKTFQGVDFDSFLRNLRGQFSKVLVRKPKASRSRSAEVYLLARNYNL
ncbi:MAG: 23S rRNA (uridine(2552)-2'-O)-methyltransferase RlmE [Gammaproteobacteria bacterium]|nr:23S rRNA (uridine(2552)-2'-O)-methyltransferase RlmE [Gammaproteobacteria bacterium]